MSRTVWKMGKKMPSTRYHWHITFGNKNLSLNGLHSGKVGKQQKIVESRILRLKRYNRNKRGGN